MIRLESVTKLYRTAEMETRALAGVDLNVRQGEFVAVMGPSGCGKSTLLNIVGLIDSPSSGQYYFGDHEISGYSESRLAGLRKGRIGFIFQSFNLIDSTSTKMWNCPSSTRAYPGRSAATSFGKRCSWST
ncbi:MAG: ATP-binding cassette domain-containing protein [Rhodospirillales bacterium]|nr:ATP-binding cassette domain-containing protein [Rhodospirillales bacterium]